MKSRKCDMKRKLRMKWKAKKRRRRKKTSLTTDSSFASLFSLNIISCGLIKELNLKYLKSARNFFFSSFFLLLFLFDVNVGRWCYLLSITQTHTHTYTQKSNKNTNMSGYRLHDFIFHRLRLYELHHLFFFSFFRAKQKLGKEICR